MKRESSCPDQRDAGQFGLVALVSARDTDAHILCVEKHVTGWRKIVLIENKFALKYTVFERVRAGVVRIRAISGQALSSDSTDGDTSGVRLRHYSVEDADIIDGF